MAKESNLLCKEIFKKYGFAHTARSLSVFEGYRMPHYVKDSLLLFYNDGEHNENSFLVGYGEFNSRSCLYHALTFRWISTEEELLEIYKAIKGVPLEKV